MKNAEYQENLSCPQRDSAEHEGYAGAQGVGGQVLQRPLRTRDSQKPDTLKSRTTTSLCTYAIEPTCTERYARWCERSGLLCPSYSIGFYSAVRERPDQPKY